VDVEERKRGVVLTATDPVVGGPRGLASAELLGFGKPSYGASARKKRASRSKKRSKSKKKLK
jgi:hypothetical protein